MICGLFFNGWHLGHEQSVPMSNVGQDRALTMAATDQAYYQKFGRR